MSDYEWHRSSLCASGACVEVALGDDGSVLVRDSKRGDDSPVLSFTSGAWARVLEDITYIGLPDGAGWLTDGGTYWGRLEFTADEWHAFVEDLDAFTYDRLSSGEAGSDTGVRSGQNAATGAGAIAVPPVPVAAQPLDLDEIRARADAATEGPWTLGERRVRDVDDWRLPILGHFEGEDGPYTDQIATVTYTTGGFQFPHADARADGEFIAAAREDIPALLAEVDRLSAQSRYILDKDAILELVIRYAVARIAADRAYFRTETERRAAKATADDLLDAIRGALTPVPVSEPEPAWGSGPLVEHNPSSDADTQLPYLTGQPVSFVDDGDGQAVRS